LLPRKPATSRQPSLDTCQRFANIWRSVQLAWAGEILVMTALGFIWQAWRDWRRAKKEADAEAAAENPSH
jgi:hypothetical protein